MQLKISAILSLFIFIAGASGIVRMRIGSMPGTPVNVFLTFFFLVAGVVSAVIVRHSENQAKQEE